MKTTIYLSLNDASKQTGRSKGTISKALNSGKLSYISKTNKGYKIDPSELFRVFPIKQERTGNDYQSETPKETLTELIELRIQVKAFEQQLNREQETISDLRKRLDNESEERRKLTMILTDQRIETPISEPKIGAIGHLNKWWFGK